MNTPNHKQYWKRLLRLPGPCRSFQRQPRLGPLLLSCGIAALTSWPAGADTLPELRFNSVAIAVSEANAVARLQVVRATNAERPVTVDFHTEAGSATPDADYSPVSGTLKFEPGEHLKLIEIPILNDGVAENDETFRVILANSVEGKISAENGVAIVTIQDNDAGFFFESAIVSAPESLGELAINVGRGTDRSGRISVDYLLEPETAVPGADYLPVSGTLFFEADEPVQAIRIPILQDSSTEGPETFRVVLQNPSAGTLVVAPGTATVRIIDDDPGFSLSSAVFEVQERDEEMAITVLRGAAPPDEASVEYSTEAASATEGLDYMAARGRLVFAPGQTTGTIWVRIMKDSLGEPTETFRVVLSNPSSGASLGRPSVSTVRILDDDPGFHFDAPSYSVSETERSVRVTVWRGTDAPGEVTVDYSTEPVSATPDLDYSPVSGTLVFAADTHSQTIEIPIIGDLQEEPRESFRVVLSQPSAGVRLGTRRTATVFIVDSQPGFRFESNIETIGEADGKIILRVNRGAEPIGVSSVHYSVEPISAVADEDYLPVSGTLVFQDGEDFQTIAVPILNDGIRESLETFRVVLSNPSAGSGLGIPSTTTVRISDNDSGFTFGEGPFRFSETAGTVELTVYRGSDGAGEMSVDYSVEPGSATPDLDYVPARGTLHFGATEPFKRLQLAILNDSLIEPLETFRVVLSNPSPNAALGARAVASVTIEDNDLGFVLQCPPSEPNCTYTREDSGFVSVDVAIIGDFQLANPVSVEVATQPVRAAADVDYLSRWETLVFAPGETRKTLNVPIVNDSLIEPEENFRIVLRNPAGLPVANPGTILVITIQDNERGYWIERSPNLDRLLIRENSGGGLVNIHREGDFNFTSSVDVRTLSARESGSTATVGEDFLDVFARVTFGPGETNQTVALQVIDDSIIESGEGFYLELHNPTGGVPILEHLRWIEIEDNELNPLRVDPDFLPAVYYARIGGEAGDDGIHMLADGRIIMPTPLWRLTGEDGMGVVRLFSNGALDPTFEMARVWGLETLALQPNEKVLVGGAPEMRINGLTTSQLARLNSDGSLDATFSAQLPRRDTAVAALAVQPDGKILVATYWDGAVLRLEPDGTADAGFRPVRIDGSVERILLDQANRSLIWGGYAFSTVNDKPRPGLARLLSDGSLDQEFLADWQLGVIDRFALEADDSILIRYGSPSPALARLTPEGMLDPAFHPDLANPVNFFAAVPTNKILVSVQSQFGSGLVSRLNSDGSTDESFIPGTYTVTFPTSGGWGASYSLTPGANGDLLVTGDVLAVNGQGEPGPVRLLLNSPVPRIEVDASSATVMESDKITHVTLLRTGDTSASLTVNWIAEGGFALPGLDYVAASGTITFDPGEARQTVALQLLDNADADGDRDVRLRLTGPDGKALPDAVITIRNDDPGFVLESTGAFPDGRFLITITGHGGRSNVRLQRASHLGAWEDWIWPSNESQFMDYDVPTTGPDRRFYRLLVE